MGWLLKLFPGTWWIYVVVLTAAVAAGAAGAYKVEEWRYAAKEKDRVEAQLLQEQLQAAETFRKSEKVIAAQSAGAARLVALGNAVVSSRNALDSLRDTAAMRLQAAAGSLDTCNANATTLNLVFGQCGKRLTEVAKDAGVWANYAQTLTESWPK